MLNIMSSDSMRALCSVWVTCQMMAQPDAPLVTMETAWPAQMIETMRSQRDESGLPEALMRSWLVRACADASPPSSKRAIVSDRFVSACIDASSGIFASIS